MSSSPFVLQATRENFNQLVLGNSDKGPVMVHFWTPKAGPCMLLNPRLIKLVTEYCGKCLLVLANTDELGQIAHHYGVTSVPTVKFFRQGKVVHTVHGAESDAVFHKVLAGYIARDVDITHVRALESQRRGDFQTARLQLIESAHSCRSGETADDGRRISNSARFTEGLDDLTTCRRGDRPPNGSSGFYSDRANGAA